MQGKKRSAFRSSSWIIVGLSILVVVTIFYNIYDYRQSRADIVTLLRDRGRLITDLILRTGMAALEFSEDRMLEEAERVKLLDRTIGFDEQLQKDYNANPSPFFIILLDSSGKTENHLGYPPRVIQALVTEIQHRLQEFKATGKEYEIFEISALERRRHSAGDILILRREAHPGYILLTHKPRQMLRRIGPFNLQNIVDRFIENLPIRYIAFMTSDRIIALGGEIDSAAVLNLLSLNITNRISEKDGKKVFEYQQVLPPPRVADTRVFVGLYASELDQLEGRLQRRIILSAIIFLFLGTVSVIFILSGQKYRQLSAEYRAIKDHTGNILHNMGEGIITLDHNSQVTVANRAAREILNLSFSETVDISEISVRLPRLGEILTNRANVKNEEESCEINGERKYISVTTSVFSESGSGGPVFILLLQDITAIKQLQDQLFRQDKLNAMGKLASRVAHEIRNPLNAIGMNVQRLKREFHPQKDKREYEELTKTVVGEVNRVNRIIESFLQFARPPRLTKKIGDLRSLLFEIKTITQPVWMEKNIGFEIEAPDAIDLNFDHDQFKQALLNLVQNSIDACSVEDKILLILQRQQNMIKLMIQDTGTGIAKEDLPRIFELYFTTKINGTGLGLSLAHKIIHAHNGKLSVESPYTDQSGIEIPGCRFTMIIPVDVD